MPIIFCSCEREVPIPPYLMGFYHYVFPTLHNLLLQNITPTVLTVQFGDEEKKKSTSQNNDQFWLPNLYSTEYNIL